MLSMNRFPYDIVTSVEHWILWSSDKDFKLEDAKTIASELAPNQTRYVHLNDSGNRSIPSVLHFHIFIDETQPLNDA